ncbi:hypothetical protein B0T19DRAFT_142945 [Cercophora scortea]|uniref:Uncharacterized protein n=1 Tax=Cercophora scortea TaxID=314031 RepID=A0AAE0IZQ0_9PEZI|nr:hypothetical protein B0T19DRAFT_142945 [Cercophora scortea]
MLVEIRHTRKYGGARYTSAHVLKGRETTTVSRVRGELHLTARKQKDSATATALGRANVLLSPGRGGGWRRSTYAQKRSQQGWLFERGGRREKPLVRQSLCKDRLAFKRDVLSSDSGELVCYRHRGLFEWEARWEMCVRAVRMCCVVVVSGLGLGEGCCCHGRQNTPSLLLGAKSLWWPEFAGIASIWAEQCRRRADGCAGDFSPCWKSSSFRRRASTLCCGQKIGGKKIEVDGRGDFWRRRLTKPGRDMEIRAKRAGPRAAQDWNRWMDGWWPWWVVGGGQWALVARGKVPTTVWFCPKNCIQGLGRVLVVGQLGWLDWPRSAWLGAQRKPTSPLSSTVLLQRPPQLPTVRDPEVDSRLLPFASCGAAPSFVYTSGPDTDSVNRPRETEPGNRCAFLLQNPMRLLMLFACFRYLLLSNVPHPALPSGRFVEAMSMSIEGL